MSITQLTLPEYDSKPLRNVYIVGIKGVAMAQIALILHTMGAQVSGYDVEESFITDASLSKMDIRIDHRVPVDTKGYDCIVYSAAHGGSTNQIVKNAQNSGIPVLHQIEMIALLISRYQRSLAVAGCHGKTTTSALLSWTLTQLNADPGYLVGTSSFSGLPAGAVGSGDWFVLEADEYGFSPPHDMRSKLLSIRPDYALVTNIDYDHPDMFESIEEVAELYERFIKEHASHSVVCGDDPRLAAIAEKNPDRVITYGTRESDRYRLISNTTTEMGESVTILRGNEELGDFTTGLFGGKNALNITGTVALLMESGFSDEAIRDALRGFYGAKRRFELLYEGTSLDGYCISVFDDYAHHPAELSALLELARSRYPQRKVYLVFEPHTYSRTAALLNDFLESLYKADKAYLLPVFASARETSHGSVELTGRIREHIEKDSRTSIRYVEDSSDLPELLASDINADAIILFAGAGTVYTRAQAVAQKLGVARKSVDPA